MDKTRRKFSAPDPQQRKENLRIFLYAMAGLLISIASFVLHHYFGHFVAVTVLLCIADLFYAFYHARIFFAARDWRWEKHLVTLMMLICYWAVVFMILCAGNALTLKVPFSYAFFVYPVFLMPSFVIVILSVCLVLAGLSYV